MLLFVYLWLHIDLTSGTQLALQAAGGLCQPAQWSVLLCVNNKHIGMAFHMSNGRAVLGTLKIKMSKKKKKQTNAKVYNINSLFQQTGIERVG